MLKMLIIQDQDGICALKLYCPLMVGGLHTVYFSPPAKCYLLDYKVITSYSQIREPGLMSVSTSCISSLVSVGFQQVFPFSKYRKPSPHELCDILPSHSLSYSEILGCKHNATQVFKESYKTCLESSHGAPSANLLEGTKWMCC